MMMETDTLICFNNAQIENVESYIYVGQRYRTKDKHQDNDIQRRIAAEWKTFAMHRDIFKGNIGTFLKRQIYNSHLLPAMAYDAETRALTTQAKNKLSATQTKMDVKLHIPGQKNKYLGKRKHQGHRRD